MRRRRDGLELLVLGGASLVELLETACRAWPGPGPLHLRVAATLEEAVAEAQGGRADLVALDLDLAAIGGHEALRFLRERAPGAPVLVVGGGTSETAELLALRDGAQEALSRDDLERPETLRRAILHAVERHGFEADLRQARDAAEKRCRRRAELVAVVSHEIRSPASTVVGFAELLLDGPLAIEQRDFANRILRASRNLVSLAGDLLTLSADDARVSSLAPVPTDLEDLVTEVFDSCERAARDQGVALTRDVSPAMRGPRLVDRGRLRQVLVNLVGNAVKFAPRGSVRVRVAPDRLHADGVRFEVSDTGIGIPAERLELVFEPFTQADPSIRERFGGSGLGLAVSKRLVEMMGGRIGVESQVGVGSRFFFTVPLARASGRPAARERIEGAGDEPPRRKNARILLAEDSPDTQALMIRLLAREGYSADVVADGGAAIEAFAASRYDLVLLDIQMPTVDGYQAAAAMRRLEADCGRSPTPLVALTAHAMEEEIRRCLAAGCTTHLPKPVDRTRLRELLREHLELAGANPAPQGFSATS